MAFSLTFPELDRYSAVTNPAEDLQDIVSTLDAVITRKRKQREVQVTVLKEMTQELRVLQKAAKVIADLQTMNAHLTLTNHSLESELDDALEAKFRKVSPAGENKEHAEASAASEPAVRN